VKLTEIWGFLTQQAREHGQMPVDQGQILTDFN